MLVSKGANSGGSGDDLTRNGDAVSTFFWLNRNDEDRNCTFATFPGDVELPNVRYMDPGACAIRDLFAATTAVRGLFAARRNIRNEQEGGAGSPWPF